MRTIIFISVAILLLPIVAMADIYRFVTVDGVETFTNVPVNKDAKVVVKEPTQTKQATKHQKKKNVAEKTHNLSLNEIAEKTVNNTINAKKPQKAVFLPHLPTIGGKITSGVGMRTDPIDGKQRYHNGIDIAVPEGTRLTPAAEGVVIYAGERSGYGNTVIIEHENGMVTLYGHNSRLMVSQGEQIDSDTVVALTGNTGRSTGPHLHFEAWLGGKNITPSFMPGSTQKIPTAEVASSKQRTQFRKTLLDDGSILFTNLP